MSAAAYEIVDAKRQHCGQIVRYMREGHRAALRRQGKIDQHRELVRTFNASALKRACIMNGKPVAMWGVTGPMLAGEGEIWLVVTKDAERLARALYAETRKQLGYFLSLWPELKATVLIADPASMRFARHLGFQPDGEPRDGILTITIARA